MKNGVYTGELRYSIGSGQQIDIGKGRYNHDSITFKFELTVDHKFQLDFPPGSERVLLQPPGGWSQWANQGRTPPALRREMPFRLWSSGPFMVYLSDCEYRVAGQCGIHNTNDNHTVPLEVAVTLPGIIAESTGSFVHKQLLGTDKFTAERLSSASYIVNQRSLLHFEVGQASVAEMMRYPGGNYKGNVTVMFDSDF